LRFRLLLLLAGILAAAAPGAGAAERAVDLELVLAVDVSGSMDEDEHQLQRQGYVQAFRHPGVIQVIASGFHGRIAVTYFEWAGPGGQSITAPWTEIHDAKSANAFADVLASQPIAFIRGTSISGGLLFGAGLFDDNGFMAPRRVIDVSGDGANNMGLPVEEARDRVVAQGITINGLPLMLKHYRTGGADLDQYFKDCVIGGTGAFVVPVKEEIGMARAIRRKLILEIAGLTHGPRLTPAAFPAKADCMIGEKWRQSWDDW